MKLLYTCAISLLLVISMFIQGCGMRTSIGGTEEGVVIKKPWVFGFEGVVSEPIETGTHFKVPTTSVVKFDMVPFQKKEPFIDLISKDRKPIDIDVYVQLKISDNKTPQLYKNFGLKAYEDNISKPFRSAFREIAKQYTMWELVEDITVMREVERTSRLILERIIEQKTVPYDILSVEVSKANPPDEVKAEVNQTAAQTQRKETEKAKESAEKSRRDAEIARAKADKAYQNEMGVNSDQYIELMKIDAQYKLIEMVGKKKDPMTLLIGVDGVAVPAK